MTQKPYIVLFPGAFKPFHDGHYSIIESYFQREQQPEKFQCIISKKDRMGLTAKTSYNFMKKVFENSPYSIDVEICDIDSPIRKCYQILQDDEDNDYLYCLAASSKDGQAKYKYFYKDFSKGGKYYNGQDKVVEFDDFGLNDPLSYEGRDDEFEGKPISASVCRNDILNDDFDLFKTSYNYLLSNDLISEDELMTYFKILHLEIEDEAEDKEQSNKIKNLLSEMQKSCIIFDNKYNNDKNKFLLQWL